MSLLLLDLTTSKKPSTIPGVQIPEIVRLKDVPQDPKNHPEGSAWIHSMQVLDRMSILKFWAPQKTQRALVLAAWLHDIGKWEKTFYRSLDKKDKNFIHWSQPRPKNTRIIAYGHDIASAKLVKPILNRLPTLDNEEELKNLVAILVRHHMAPLLLKSAKRKAFLKLRDKHVPLFLLGILNWADKGVRPQQWFNKILEIEK